jgi:membrane protease subunit (stomatin/prohibitin family)
VKKAINQRTSMGALGIGPGGAGYMQMMAANSMETAAKNPGTAGGMMGAGLGMGYGMMMPGMMANSFGGPQQMMGQQPQAPAAAPPPLPAALTFHAAIGGAQQGPFDQNTLQGMKAQGQLTEATLVWRQGMAGWTAAKDVPQLAGIFAAPPPLPGAPPPLPPPA